MLTVKGVFTDALNARMGLLREDLFARINLLTYELLLLKERIEDLEPNIEQELQKLTRTAGYKINFNKGARSICKSIFQRLASSKAMPAKIRVKFFLSNGRLVCLLTIYHC